MTTPRDTSQPPRALPGSGLERDRKMALGVGNGQWRAGPDPFYRGALQNVNRLSFPTRSTAETAISAVGAPRATWRSFRGRMR